LSVFNILGRHEETKLRSQTDESKRARENEIISLLGAGRVIILPLLLPSFGTAGCSLEVLGYCPWSVWEILNFQAFILEALGLWAFGDL